MQEMAQEAHWDDETMPLLPDKDLTTRAIYSPDVPPWEESRIYSQSGALKFPLEASLDSQTIFRIISPLLLALAAYQTGHRETIEDPVGSRYMPTGVIVTDQDHSEMVSGGFDAQGHGLASPENQISISHLASKIARGLDINRSEYYRLVYVIAGGLLARSLSRLVGYGLCNEVGMMFASVLAIILTAMSDYYRGEPKSERKSSHILPSFNSYRDMFIAAMKTHGLAYGDIQVVVHTNHTYEAEKCRDGEPELLERFLITGIPTLGNPVKGSFQVNYYHNGSVVIHSTSGIVEDLTTGLGKRYHHPGFKVTFDMYKQIKEYFTEDDCEDMATEIAGYWAASGTASNAECIGYEAERNKVNLYIKIIPEVPQNIEGK